MVFPFCTHLIIRHRSLGVQFVVIVIKVSFRSNILPEYLLEFYRRVKQEKYKDNVVFYDSKLIQ